MSLNEYNENLHCTEFDPTEHNEYKLTEKQISAFNDLINKSVFYVDHLYCKDIVVNGKYVTFRNDKGRVCFVYSVSGIQPDFCNTPASEDKNIHVEKIAEKVFVGSPLIGSIIGMSFCYSTLGVISVNRNLDLIWRMFAYWHELAHVFRGHIDDPGFGYHQDRGLFSVPVDSRAISRQEREANIISAEYNISTEDVLDLISYENQTMKDYLELKRKQEETARAYDKLRFSADSTAMIRYRLAEYRHALRILDEKRQDLESEMVSMNCVKSISEIAGELNTSEVILKYKLEAMCLRGYDIDVTELERYDQVFKDVR